MKLLCAGDFCPVNRVEQLALTGRAAAVFGNVITELHDKDLSVVDLECPLTESPLSLSKSGPNIKANPKTIACLKAGKFDIANIANNHIMDYGPTGIRETIGLLQSNNIKSVGAGFSLSEAQKPLVAQLDGELVAFLAFAENEFSCADETSAGAWPLDPVVNISQIKNAKTVADVIVVLVHGGSEFSPVPSPRMVKTYRAFVDAGATAVIGTHPHVPQGYELYNNAPIFYSLGNLAFDPPPRRAQITTRTLWSKGFVVRLHIHGHNTKDFEIVPFKALPQTGCLTLLEEEELDTFREYVGLLSKILNSERETRECWEAWCALMGPRYLRSLSPSSLIACLRTSIPSGDPVSSKGFLVTRNIIACQSHSDVLGTFMDLVRKKRIDTAKRYANRIKTLQKGIVSR